MNADHVGREVTVSALGKQWTFARWTREIEDKYCDFARSILPDPIEVVSRNLDKIALKDAAIIRQLQIDDNAERVKAAEEHRPAILMFPQYTPFADVMVDKAINKASLYLGYGSPEVNSTLRSTQGTSFLSRLLLLQHHPEIDRQTAQNIVEELGDKIQSVLEVCRGKLDALPKNVEGRAASKPDVSQANGQSQPTGDVSTETSAKPTPA